MPGRPGLRSFSASIGIRSTARAIPTFSPGVWEDALYRQTPLMLGRPPLSAQAAGNGRSRLRENIVFKKYSLSQRQPRKLMLALPRV